MKIDEIKAKYRSEEYVIEPGDEESKNRLLAAVPTMRPEKDNVLLFKEGAQTLYDVMGVIVEHKLSVLRIEKREPDLETLFMEVVER